VSPKTTGVSPRHTPHHLPWHRFSKPTLPLPTKLFIPYNPDLDDLASKIWTHLKTLNNPPFLFRHEGQLCRIETDGNGAPVPASVNVHKMNYFLTELYDWGGARSRITRPPRDLAQHLLADPDPPVPALYRIVTAPIFASSGHLLDKPCEYVGGILYLPPKSFHFPSLPLHPSEDDIRAAVEHIARNLLADFQFVGESERANCYAALLTPFVREMIDGPTPMFWIDKSKGGAGGTLLSGVISAPILGVAPSGVTAPRDEAEWMRVILSKLRGSPNVFFIDNCNAYLSSEALASAITGSRYEGRVVGSSNNVSSEARCLWVINGNNLRLGWELTRRVVRIRIEANEPGHNYVHEDLLSWHIKNRADIIYQLVVLIRAWEVGGCPAPPAGTPEFASFESWRKVVGGILHTAGIPGFLDNLQDARRQADEESEDIRGFLCEWEARIGSRPVFASDLVLIGQDFFQLQKDPKPAAIQLGKNILAKYQNQVHDGRRIHRLPESKGKTQWQLQIVPTARS
jgi:putative DNA primase/helicase